MASYASVANFRAAIDTGTTDATDDAYIQTLLDAATAKIDALTGRRFSATSATRYYDVPRSRRLWLDADLLTVTAITNGDGSTISSSEYVLEPAIPPYYAITLRKSASISWEPDASGDTEQVVAVVGTWGYSATPPADIVQATLIIAVSYYRARYGADTAGPVTVTPAGIVLTDGSIPRPALALITPYVRYSLAAA